MKTLFAIAVIFFTPAAFSQEVYKINANKFCADIVGIPYASDNFSDEEWEKFKQCLNIVRQYKVK